MGRLVEDKDLRNKVYAFRDRTEAGRQLAAKLSDYKSSDTIVFAVPAGGVPVAYEVANKLKLQMDIVIVRKIQIPGNTEAGFGAVGPDGEVIFNERLLSSLMLTQKEIEIQVEKTKNVVNERNSLYRGEKPLPDISDKNVILVDDGLASGYTMSEAVRFIKRKRVKKVIVAVPTASESSINLLLPDLDELYALNIRGMPFAVADAYQKWYDVNDEEVISFLKKVHSQKEGKSES